MSVVFEWKSPELWRECVKTLAKDMIDPAVVKVVRRSEPERIVCDDSAWLDDAMRACGIHLREDAFTVLGKRLSTHYSHIRAYHACRTPDPKSYYSRGLRIASGARLKEIAEKAFAFSEFREISERMIGQAIEEFWHEARALDGRVFLGLDDRHLVRCCGHYLIYGSESLTAVAKRLEQKTGRNYMRLLRDTGTPTMFVCEVPFAMVKEWEVQQLSGIILQGLFKEILHGIPMERRLGFTITSMEDIPANCIKDHYHPNGIPDPLNHPKKYNW